MTDKSNGRKRGRPTGFRLSEASKRQISVSKTGQQHKQETKDKISNTLLVYFRRKNPFSDEIINSYCRADDDEVCGWVNDVQEQLDNLDDVKTERVMRNNRKTELAFGNNIEYFGHRVTPELMVLFKEYCEENELDFEETLATL